MGTHLYAVNRERKMALDLGRALLLDLEPFREAGPSGRLRLSLADILQACRTPPDAGFTPTELRRWASDHVWACASIARWMANHDVNQCEILGEDAFWLDVAGGVAHVGTATEPVGQWQVAYWRLQDDS